MSGLVEHDRGLGSAYERYCFYQRIDAWARRFEVESALEGPVDGMAGIRSVHGVGLARRGVKVLCAAPTDEIAGRARAVYEAAGGGPNVEMHVVADPMKVAELPVCDLVLSYHALPFVPDWRAYLGALRSRARKVLVVAICNPDNWGFTAVRLAARLRGLKGMEPPDVWRTDVLAPALWAHGRVTDHVYFDCPWWPDMPVSAGQSVVDRGKQLVRELLRGKKNGSAEGAALSDKFVYGPERWPYFGGPGWVDELLPALLRHPCFDGANTKLLPRLAHLHAFVVDVRPRTPQGRRRLAQVQ